MNPSKTTYCALYEDGSFVEKDTIKELDAVPAYCFLLQVDRVPNGINYQFKPITKDSYTTTIRIGNFGIIDIGPQQGTNYEYRGISIKIFDYNKQASYDYTARSTRKLDVFKDEIFPLMNKLNELGSWENYENQKKMINIQKENEEMTVEIKMLKEKIQQFEEALENTKLKALS